MDRRSVIKSLFTLALAPKIITEIEFKPPVVYPVLGRNATLFNNLQLLNPRWMPAIIEKYGNDDFVSLMNEMGTIKTFAHNEVVVFKDGEWITRKAEPGETFTFTIKPKYIENAK